MTVLQFFGKVLVALGLIVGLMGGSVAWSEPEKPAETKPAAKNVLKDTFNKLVGKTDDGEVSQKDAANERKAKSHEVKKAVKTSKAAKKAEPPAEAEKKEESQGVLSKITESVTDTVKSTMEVLTPGSKEDKAKKPDP